MQMYCLLLLLVAPFACGVRAVEQGLDLHGTLVSDTQVQAAGGQASNATESAKDSIKFASDTYAMIKNLVTLVRRTMKDNTTSQLRANSDMTLISSMLEFEFAEDLDKIEKNVANKLKQPGFDDAADTDCSELRDSMTDLRHVISELVVESKGKLQALSENPGDFLEDVHLKTNDFRLKTTDQTEQWLRDKGLFELLAKPVETPVVHRKKTDKRGWKAPVVPSEWSPKFDGWALSVLTPWVMTKYWEVDAKTAAKVRCHIDAELAGQGEKRTDCDSPSPTQRFWGVMRWVEAWTLKSTDFNNFLHFAIKSPSAQNVADGKIASNWLIGALDRLLTAYPFTPANIQTMASHTMLVSNVMKHSRTLYGQLSGDEYINPIAYIASASWMITEFDKATYKAMSCSAIKKMLMDQGTLTAVSEHKGSEERTVDTAIVEAPLTDQDGETTV